MTWTWYFHHNR